MAAAYRRAEPSSNSFDPVYTAGFCVSGSLLLGTAIWLLITLSRKRARTKRENRRHAALSVRGVSRESASSKPIKIPIAQPQSKKFLRQHLDTTVALPERALRPPPRPYPTDDNGKFPELYPFSASSIHPQSHSHLTVPSFTNSDPKRFSVYSTSSPVDNNSAGGIPCKVRQSFDPLLPDELFVRADELLTLVQTFNDGWCLIGRESTSLVENAKSLLRPNTVGDKSIELGVVPAWCFIEDSPGLRLERPFRSTSLGITVQLNAPTPSREKVISWSNFY